MAGTKVEPSKTTHGEITLDLSAAAGPAVEERREDDQEDVGQEDGQEKGGVGGRGRLGGWGGRGETRGSDVPSRCTYMVKPPGFFFFFPPIDRLEQVHLYGEATRTDWGA